MTQTAPAAPLVTPSIGAAILLRVIAAYQRWLSPRKGFACAYRVRHGGTGCSGYAKVTIRAEGLAAWPGVRARLSACAVAASELHEEAEGEEDDPAARRRSRTDRCDDALDLSWFSCETAACLGHVGSSARAAARPSRPGGLDCGDCDVLPCGW